MHNILLLLLAIIPPVAFLLYVMHMDRQEPEPWGFIMKVMLLGGMSCVPAGIVEYMLGALPFFTGGGITGAFIKSFFLIAPVEELAKLLVVLLFVWNNKNFDEVNDGIVYVGTAAIGFALAENIMYVLQHGLPVGFARALTAIPLHTFSGVIMGYYTGIARFTEDKQKRSALIVKGLLYAWGIHGLYDTFALSHSIAGILILPMVAILFVVGIRFLKKGRGISIRNWAMAGRNTGKVTVNEEKRADQNGAVAEMKGTSEELLARKESLQHDLPQVYIHGNGPKDEYKSAQRRGGFYKIIISRILLGGSLLFWIFLSMGYFNKSLNTGLNLFEYLVGGTVLTIVPIMLGIVLEVSYRRRNRV